MKKIKAIIVCGLLAAAFGACAYSGTAVAGDKVIVLRNDLFLLGLRRKAFVCQITESGLSNCVANENP